MTITELIQILQEHQKNIGCDGKSISSHNIESQVSFYITDTDFDGGVELDCSVFPNGIELDLMPGCICPQGIIFNLKQKL